MSGVDLGTAPVATNMRWTDTERVALVRARRRMQELMPDRVVGWSDVVRVLVSAYAAGVGVEEMIGGKGR